MCRSPHCLEDAPRSHVPRPWFRRSDRLPSIGGMPGMISPWRGRGNRPSSLIGLPLDTDNVMMDRRRAATLEYGTVRPTIGSSWPQARPGQEHCCLSRPSDSVATAALRFSPSHSLARNSWLLLLLPLNCSPLYFLPLTHPFSRSSPSPECL